MKNLPAIGLFLIVLFVFGTSSALAQKTSPKIGAYYFDGWSGTTFHITDDLKNNYPEREPKWGWVTSKQEIVDEQIALAADAGLSFFSFCWYFSEKQKYDDIILNNALNYFKRSKNGKMMEYCLLVANHAGFNIGPEGWDQVTQIWLKEFQQPQYLRVDGKPLLIFFEYNSLIKNFGSAEAVNEAFDKLKLQALKSGLKGVTVAICTASEDGAGIAKDCGADVVTGYNYHSAGFVAGQLATPIENMQLAEKKLWDKLGSGNLKYIPVCTVGWDPRPWANDKNKYLEKPYYTGFSAESAQRSVKGLVNWISENQKAVTGEKIGLLYAWNENGEGSWLTPGKTGLNPLTGLKQALKK
ncbi:glycoside hydrolase family 99-like domain-containing protein [Dyadobacter sp. CY312]|uniref:glycoside hydrolase family 99-like domain-containing protein n=1 Tax=Dyadobacter sp. CY312 TaxID=2907303 RepID=UPI001F1DB1A0|nr:glycoside hydrolase family 99-like domain-containing protein [Dyadobacter sp. CY312]MCE7042821.1 glycoside hydrolase family 99-like domain-containing protein [Dyadobacter sp. CY312]